MTIIKHLSKTSQHLLFWSLMLSALLLTLLRLILIDLGPYKTLLEEQILATSQLPVKIGKLSATMHHFSPSLLLQQVSIANQEQQDSPSISEVRVELDLLALLTSFNIVSSQKISLIGANMQLIRNMDGSIAILGLPGGKQQPEWLLQGKHYQILDSQIGWQDLSNQLPKLQFSHVNCLLKNHQQSHELHVLTQLPAEYGDSLRISAQLQGDPFASQALSGRIYIDAVNLQFPELLAKVLPIDLKLNAGSGDLRLWTDWQDNQLSQLTGYLQAQQITVSNSHGLSKHLDTLQGNLAINITEQYRQLSVYDLDIVAYHQRWLDGELSLRQDQSGVYAGTIKQFNIAVLGLLSPLVNQLAPELVKTANIQPSGNLHDFKFWFKPDAQLWAINGEFKDLKLEHAPSIAKLSGLSGKISGTEQQGQLQLNSQQLAIDAPEIFNNALVVESLQGLLAWQQRDTSWLISSRDLQIATPDFQTESDFDLTLGKNQTAPYLELSSRLSNFKDISHIKHYLPFKIMDKNAANWLEPAFIAGQISHADLYVLGRLDQFPFTDNNGKFDLLINIDNAELLFNPEWPSIKGGYAQVHFQGPDLQISVNDGYSEDVTIDQAEIDIKHYATSEHLLVKGQLHAKVNQALQYLQNTPLKSKVQDLVQVIDSDSLTKVDIDLNIPYFLNMPLYTTVLAHLDNAQLTVKPIDLKVSNISGLLKFTQEQITSEGLNALALGYPIQANLFSEANDTKLKIAGSSSFSNIARQFPMLNNQAVNGNFNYLADLSLPSIAGQHSTLTISSDLKGISIDSIEALSKSADAVTALRVDLQFDRSALLPIQLHYGEQFNAALYLDLEQNRLLSGNIVLGNKDAEFIKQAGLYLSINQKSFKLTTALTALNSQDNQWPALRDIKIDSQQLLWMGHDLGAMQSHFVHTNSGWQGEIDNVLAKGKVFIPDTSANNDVLKLDMDFLNLSAMIALNLSGEEVEYTLLPLISIDSQKLLWHDVNLGRLKLQTERLNQGTHFKNITISNAGRELQVNADWLKQPHGTSTLINGNLKVVNFGQFLSELGYNDEIKETNAEFTFTGGWNAAPLQFSFDKLNGQLQFTLKDGRLANIEPGFGRLLGLIAMEQWAKRLSLDFSDIYQQGLSFQTISGSFAITNGIAENRNLLVDAIATKMHLVGSVNLPNKTIEQHVLVLPKSTDALPIAGRIVDNLAGMISTVVSNDYQDGLFFGSEYKVYGPWGKIEVTPITEHEGIVNKTWHGLTDFNWLKNLTP